MNTLIPWAVAGESGRPARGRSPVRGAALGLVWLAALTAGTGWMAWYTRLPGKGEGAPARWPRATAVARDRSRCTLLLFLHPQCPGGPATLAELERFAVRAGKGCAIHVLFTGRERGAGTLWDQARTIRGAVAEPDRDGIEAARFHAGASGWTLLYGPEGDLFFQGGIVPARGREGDGKIFS